MTAYLLFFFLTNVALAMWVPCYDLRVPSEVRQNVIEQAPHFRRKRQSLEMARYNRYCRPVTFNPIYPYRTYPLNYRGSDFYSGPFLTHPFLGSSGQIYEWPLSYFLHRNTGFLQPMFHHYEVRYLHEQTPPL